MCTDNELREKIAYYKECKKQADLFENMKKAAAAEIMEELKSRRVSKFEKCSHVIRVTERPDAKALKEMFPEVWEQVKTESISEYITAR